MRQKRLQDSFRQLPQGVGAPKDRLAYLVAICAPARSCLTRGGRTDGGSVIIALSRSTVLMTKYVFVTGGVVSSLGKGIAAASLGA
ncbi:MAG: hypothetical protein LBP58_04825, partial [Azoarcus sp.]|nr:hypothetical protein [Azoarcus sp.]